MNIWAISHHSISAQPLSLLCISEVVHGGFLKSLWKNHTFFPLSLHLTAKQFLPIIPPAGGPMSCKGVPWCFIGGGAFIPRTFKPGYIQRNQRRHLHTVCVSCLRSWDRSWSSSCVQGGMFWLFKLFTGGYRRGEMKEGDDEERN